MLYSAVSVVKAPYPQNMKEMGLKKAENMAGGYKEWIEKK